MRKDITAPFSAMSVGLSLGSKKWQGQPRIIAPLEAACVCRQVKGQANHDPSTQWNTAQQEKGMNLQQHGQTSNHAEWKKPDPKHHTVWLHLYEMARKGKPIDSGSTSVVAWGLGRSEGRRDLLVVMETSKAGSWIALHHLVNFTVCRWYCKKYK